MENTKTTKRINQLRKSIALQNRTKAGLEKMQIADAGKTVSLCNQIIAGLEAQLAIYTQESGKVIA